MKTKSPGYLVTHKTTGKTGRTYHNKGMIEGKIPVYFEQGGQFMFSETATLCAPENLIKVGFID